MSWTLSSRCYTFGENKIKNGSVSYLKGHLTSEMITPTKLCKLFPSSWSPFPIGLVVLTLPRHKWFLIHPVIYRLNYNSSVVTTWKLNLSLMWIWTGNHTVKPKVLIRSPKWHRFGAILAQMALGRIGFWVRISAFRFTVQLGVAPECILVIFYVRVFVLHFYPFLQSQV